MTFDQNARNMMVLIPDSVDYEETFIDHYLKWMAENDPNDIKGKRFQVEAHAEIEYFQRRKEELAAQADTLVSDLEDEEDNKSQKKEDYKPELGGVREVDEIEKFEQNLESYYDRKKGRTGRRYQELQRQCNERIELAKKKLQGGGDFPTIESSNR